MLGWLLLGALISMCVYSIVEYIAYISRSILQQKLKEYKARLAKENIIKSVNSKIRVSIENKTHKTIKAKIYEENNHVADLDLSADEIEDDITSGEIMCA